MVESEQGPLHLGMGEPSQAIAVDQSEVSILTRGGQAVAIQVDIVQWAALLSRLNTLERHINALTRRVEYLTAQMNQSHSDPHDPFWHPYPTATLAALQGVEPIADPNQLAGNIWPEDESVDEFLESLKPQP
jgi:hypothetical protein